VSPGAWAMSARQTTVTPWETRIGVKVECLRCEYTALCASSPDAFLVARSHSARTGHTVHVSQVQGCTVSPSARLAVVPVEEPNPHVQQTWDAGSAG
jgi:hypothetical protein